MVFICMTCVCCSIQMGMAQGAPKGINYQACARNNIGDELVKRIIDVRITIYAEEASAENAEWIENHKTVTNDYGIFSIIIGQGSREGGSEDEFSAITWGADPHFMKVEIDFGGGYRNMGISQFVSVPYAMYAEYAGKFGTGDTLGSGIGIQTLSLNSNKELSISQGNTVTLDVDDADANPLNEIQDLRLTNDSLYLNLKTEPTRLDMSQYRDNTDAQILDYVNGMLSISGGNSVDIRTSLIGFSASKDKGGNFFTDFDTLMIFDELEEYGGDNYIESTGIFTVPSNGAGLYLFSITYDFADNQLIEIKLTKGVDISYIPIAGVNDENNGLEGYHTISLPLLLNDEDQVGVKLFAPAFSLDGSGRFSGFKIR